ncbi:Uncharacterised protein [Pasteurella multocida]|nr:Uncharacterised protein [Pasteurella multocida]
MGVFYKEGFYLDGQQIPKGAVEITEQRYIELLEGQAKGKIIVTNKSNEPILTDPPLTDHHEWDGEKWFIAQEKQIKVKRELIKSLIDDIDNAAASILAKWTRFAEEYKEREAAAIEYKESGFKGEPSKYITMFSTVAGLDNKSATLLILKQAEGLRTLQEQLAVQRMRKYELKHEELNEEELKRIHDDIISKMKTLAEVQQ